MPELKVSALPLDEAGECEAWDAYARARDVSRGYFLLDWLRVIRQAFGHSPHPLAAYRGGAICGILPLVRVSSRLFGSFLVSLPFVNYGGVLADDPAAALALLGRAERLRQESGCDSLELRHCEPVFPTLPSLSAKEAMLLDLRSDPEAQWKGFKDKVRNQVRKAVKGGLSLESGGPELLDEFYRVFCVNMRDLGTPVYSRKFFADVLRFFPSSTRVLSVRRAGKCIASGIVYTYGDTMQMPWASSLVSERSSCPNHLLYWEAIRQASAEGFTRFDFGRSTPGSGPWNFKRQWGAYPMPLRWEYCLGLGKSLPGLNVANPKFSFAIAAWKHLPLPVANVLGPRIVRCIP